MSFALWRFFSNKSITTGVNITSEGTMKNWISTVCFLMALMAFSLTWAQSDRLLSVRDNPTGQSYFEITITDSGLFNGAYPGWCGDWTTHIQHDVQYSTRFYSPYSEIPEGLVDHPENLDEVNWIINQNFVGKNSPGGYGIYTYSDVQLAMWSLLDNFYDDSTAGPYSPQRVDEIANAARTQGSDFYPRCSQKVGMLWAPSDLTTGNRVQTTITEVPRNHFPKCVIPENDDNI